MHCKRDGRDNLRARQDRPPINVGRQIGVNLDDALNSYPDTNCSRHGLFVTYSTRKLR